jgi:hypothetical protein
MNEQTQHPLGGFERRLLRELRQVVAQNPAPVPIDRAPSRTPRRRLSLALAGGLAAILATLAVATGLFGGDADRAWAVTTNEDGTVTVEIDSLADAAGLERELGDAGLKALVQYIPPGKSCSGADVPPVPPAGTSTQTSPDSGGGPSLETAGDPREGAPAGTAKSVAVEQTDGGGVEFTIDPRTQRGETLVIRNQELSVTGTAISVALVEGQARPCELVDSAAQ